ncbi:MAG TPA: ATP-binding cassette domain-containing protein [Actinomycetes bacterium]|jgi:ABC-type nitrate/sulfonate/bicarbonate transport system ATPase subunit|nr:ATP-binding cassette domain-containing protein [Actinomycetes bacterium]
MTALLELRGVVVRARDCAILDVPGLTLHTGETLAVLGPNGAGKSTLLRVAGLLLRPDTGQLLLDGQPAREDALRRATAAVLQRPLLRRGTVADNAGLGLRFRGVGRREAQRRAAPWLDRLGIAHLAGRPGRLLSVGEGQRVSLARALATAPRLLLLDEPFAALDEPTRGQLVLDLRELLADHQVAALLVTHDRREAAALAQRTAVLDQGRLLAVGPTEHVLADPTLSPLVGASLLDAELARRLAAPQQHPARCKTPLSCERIHR